MSLIDNTRVCIVYGFTTFSIIGHVGYDPTNSVNALNEDRSNPKH